MSKLIGAKKDLIYMAPLMVKPNDRRILGAAVCRIDELERLLIDIAEAAENEAGNMAHTPGIGRTRRAIKRIDKMLGEG